MPRTSFSACLSNPAMVTSGSNWTPFVIRSAVTGKTHAGHWGWKELASLARKGGTRRAPPLTPSPTSPEPGIRHRANCRPHFTEVGGVGARDAGAHRAVSLVIERSAYTMLPKPEVSTEGLVARVEALE